MGKGSTRVDGETYGILVAASGDSPQETDNTRGDDSRV